MEHKTTEKLVIVTPQGGKKKVVRKGGKKTADRIMELIRGNPNITFAERIAVK